MVLKGAIDSIHPQRIGGWIYSDVEVIRGAEVQAFLDGDCVGAGKVERFRQDLADAGLGDGFLGFSFPITLKDPSEFERVHVRLSGSDVILLPPKAQVHVPDRYSDYFTVERSPSSFEFMRKKGWLSNSDFSFLKYSHELGVYDLSLVRLKAEQDRGESALVEPEDFAREHFGLLVLSELTVKQIDLKDPAVDDVLSAVAKVSSNPHSFVGLLADKSCSVDVIEGSHKDKVKPKSLVGSVQYPLGPDRLLFISLLCAFSINVNVVDTSLRIFVSDEYS